MFVLPSTKVEYFESPFYLSHSLALYLFMNLRFYLSVFQSLFISVALLMFTFIRTLFLKLPLSVSLFSFYLSPRNKYVIPMKETCLSLSLSGILSLSPPFSLSLNFLYRARQGVMYKYVCLNFCLSFTLSVCV